MECFFCKNCGARLLHLIHDTAPVPGAKPKPTSTANVKGGCLEDLDKEMMKRVVHIWTKHAIVDIPEDAEKWDEAPSTLIPLER